jgi:hypothetical protein
MDTGIKMRSEIKKAKQSHLHFLFSNLKTCAEHMRFFHKQEKNRLGEIAFLI